MSIRVIIPATVGLQIDKIDAWWREHREAAPRLFSEELASALELLSGAPHAGKVYRHPDVRSVRRLVLRATRYHVYYRVAASEVTVLSVWSAVRGSGPDLR